MGNIHSRPCQNTRVWIYTHVYIYIYIHIYRCIFSCRSPWSDVMLQILFCEKASRPVAQKSLEICPTLALKLKQIKQRRCCFVCWF